ncbi:uncharacterized protein LOC128149148 [Harpia harpyja]|uniref:uncharacterized protein LOC128149148 n=1 Tax=Harpia harpyja TaxID=202280 RepID=UPI0022B202D4|nr:uncharacterized protein LOC128149148 [Harpia harpyja]
MEVVTRSRGLRGDAHPTSRISARGVFMQPPRMWGSLSFGAGANQGDNLQRCCVSIAGRDAKAGALGLLVLRGSSFEQFGSESGLLGCGGGWERGGGKARLLQRGIRVRALTHPLLCPEGTWADGRCRIALQGGGRKKSPPLLPSAKRGKGRVHVGSDDTHEEDHKERSNRERASHPGAKKCRLIQVMAQKTLGAGWGRHGDNFFFYNHSRVPACSLQSRPVQLRDAVRGRSHSVHVASTVCETPGSLLKGNPDSPVSPPGREEKFGVQAEIQFAFMCLRCPSHHGSGGIFVPYFGNVSLMPQLLFEDLQKHSQDCQPALLHGTSGVIGKSLRTRWGILYGCHLWPAGISGSLFIALTEFGLSSHLLSEKPRHFPVLGNESGIPGDAGERSCDISMSLHHPKVLKSCLGHALPAISSTCNTSLLPSLYKTQVSPVRGGGEGSGWQQGPCTVLGRGWASSLPDWHLCSPCTNTSHP